MCALTLRDIPDLQVPETINPLIAAVVAHPLVCYVRHHQTATHLEILVEDRVDSRWYTLRFASASGTELWNLYTVEKWA